MKGVGMRTMLTGAGLLASQVAEAMVSKPRETLPPIRFYRQNDRDLGHSSSPRKTNGRKRAQRAKNRRNRLRRLL